MINVQVNLIQPPQPMTVRDLPNEALAMLTEGMDKGKVIFRTGLFYDRVFILSNPRCILDTWDTKNTSVLDWKCRILRQDEIVSLSNQ